MENWIGSNYFLPRLRAFHSHFPNSSGSVSADRVSWGKVVCHAPFCPSLGDSRSNQRSLEIKLTFAGEMTEKIFPFFDKKR